MFKALSKVRLSHVHKRLVHNECDYILNKYPTATGVVAALTGATLGCIVILNAVNPYDECKHSPEDDRWYDNVEYDDDKN